MAGVITSDKYGRKLTTNCNIFMPSALIAVVILTIAGVIPVLGLLWAIPVAFIGGVLLDFIGCLAILALLSSRS